MNQTTVLSEQNAKRIQKEREELSIFPNLCQVVIKHGPFTKNEVAYRCRPEEVKTISRMWNGRPSIFHIVRLHLKKGKDDEAIGFMTPEGETLLSVMDDCKARHMDYYARIFDYLKAIGAMIVEAIFFFAFFQLQTMDLMTVIISGPLLVLYTSLFWVGFQLWRYQGLHHSKKLELHCLEPDKEPDHVHVGLVVSGHVKEHLQLGCWETTPAFAKEMADEVRKAMDAQKEDLRESAANETNTVEELLSGRALQYTTRKSRKLQAGLVGSQDTTNWFLIAGVVGVIIALCAGLGWLLTHTGGGY
jgi:hypothetical protein